MRRVYTNRYASTTPYRYNPRKKYRAPVMSPVTLTLSPGWNLVALPVAPGSPTAESLLDDIVVQGGDCTEVDRWFNGGWDAHLHNLPFNDFPITIGERYFVRCNLASLYRP